ncbi:MAG: hypothetical protein KAJ73_10145 [Zetaproteobacteria bacterium]|nr:hypothetical protein [Zetaproteobacteria bacterium]
MLDIERNFMYHAATGDKASRHAAIRAKAKELAQLILEVCPTGREGSLAITKTEEAMMWANAAIARSL